MKIDEILKRKRTLSFEVFPPKRAEEGTERLFRTIDELKAFSPDFISVTYGAGGTNARNAIEISRYVRSAGVEPLAHVTGGPSDPATIKRVAAELKEAGVDNVLALRGDKPEGMDDYCKYYRHATDLMEDLRGYGFALGAACYPEGHIECASLKEDLLNLVKKQEAGASFFITQIFYDNAYYYRLVAEAARLGITVPIIPGIMPLTSAANIPRIKQMCGSTITIELRNMIEYYIDKPAVIREIGINYAVYQICDLIAKGAPGIHLYIMNSASTAAEICGRMENLFDAYFGVEKQN